MTVRRTIAALLTATLLTGVAVPAWAQSGGKKAAAPRENVEDVPGDYIQIETLWVPIISTSGSVLYRGLVLRLWPGDTTRYEACIITPFVGDYLITKLNEKPVGNDFYTDEKQMRQLIETMVIQKAGKGIFKRVDILKDFAVPDQDSAILTRTCR